MELGAAAWSESALSGEHVTSIRGGNTTGERLVYRAQIKQPEGGSTFGLPRQMETESGRGGYQRGMHARGSGSEEVSGATSVRRTERVRCYADARRRQERQQCGDKGGRLLVWGSTIPSCAACMWQWPRYQEPSFCTLACSGAGKMDGMVPEQCVVCCLGAASCSTLGTRLPCHQPTVNTLKHPAPAAHPPSPGCTCPPCTFGPPHTPPAGGRTGVHLNQWTARCMAAANSAVRQGINRWLPAQSHYGGGLGADVPTCCQNTAKVHSFVSLLLPRTSYFQPSTQLQVMQ